ncbi:GyrI-like domain-containing protein [Cytobacillus sp. FJAT-54145]|uniref:GyrI-like domain-containing protein n=1 Tax=Cytobacillus spartinae TaxID=3299023 RepID=A0ABW6KEM7_9BACI
MLQRLNDCLDYIEEHLEDEIDLDVLSSMAYVSRFHFQKMFHMLTGYTFAEYIRRRRLTLAVQELTSPNRKVIDIAIKYGYETPESFSKAFRKVHGISPSQVRDSSQVLKAFPRISFQISIKGEREMNYRFVDKENVEIVGKGIRVSTVNNENLKKIPLFWEEVNSQGIPEHLCELTGGMNVLGVCMDYDHEKEEFTYFIGVENPKSVSIDGYDKKSISASTWAVFESVGAMPHAIQAVWKRIYSEWFPSTGYQHAGGPEFELYLPGDITSEDYISEIWVPVKKQ